jgi:hypothetical protein
LFIMVAESTEILRPIAQFGCAHARILPIDSEHNAIFQCLHGQSDAAKRVRKLILTASGGPFLNRSRAELARATAEQACDHPNWKMGRKISVDSATLMNKGLEVIEARWLFGMPPERIDVLVAKAVPTVDGERVEFEPLWARREEMEVALGVRLAVPSIDDLILTKRIGGRPKDAEDIRLLRARSEER